MDISPSIELLDIVLKVIANRSTRPDTTVTPESMEEYFKDSNPILKIPLIITILNKLQKDSFIVTLDKRSGQLIGTINQFTDVSLTFDGIYFVQTYGTYANKIKIENADRDRLKTLEQTVTENRKTVTRLTWIIAIGTLIAAAYYALEILKDFKLFH